MPQSASVTSIQVEDYVFPPTIKPPGASSSSAFFLGGAGVRGLEIEGEFIKFTAQAVYLEEKAAIPSLFVKWKGKSVDELVDSVEFFRDVVTGPFEKFIQITLIRPLTGPMFSEKVMENCVAIWKSLGIYTDAEAKAADKFHEVFKDRTLAPGTSILMTQSSQGLFTIGFSKHDSIPEVGNAVIDSNHLAEAVLESIIGKHGVSPAVKQSMAARFSELLNEKVVGGEKPVTENLKP